jgi:hypothetical protein
MFQFCSNDSRQIHGRAAAERRQRYADAASFPIRLQKPLTSMTLTPLHFSGECVFWETAFALSRAYIFCRN